MTQWLHRVWFVLLVAAIVVTVSVATVAVRNRETDGAPALAVTAAAITIWLIGDLGAMLATTQAASTRWVQFLWIGAAVTPATTFVLVLQYTGRDRFLTDRVVAALGLIALATIGVALSHGAHNLLWSSIYPAPESPIGIGFDHGPAFYGYVGYAYALIAAATFFVARFYYRSKTIYRGQAAALGVGIIAPWLASAVFVFGGTTFDPSSVAFTVTAAAFGVAISRYRFVDVMPVARETIVDAIDDGVFVLDRQDRIVDVNPRGRRLLDADGRVVGRDAADVFPEPVADWDEGRDAGDEVAIDTGRGTRYLSIEETVIADRRDQPIGRLFIVRDVTERRRYERELERQNERLDRFASVVSHDLRNPLNVADGYTSILAERYDDPAVDEIETSLDRMEAIIADVLALARHGDAVSDPAETELAAPVERAWNGVDTRDATLKIETGDHTVSTDESRLVQALENLFRNAVQHGGRDVTVTVGAIESDGTSGAGEGPNGGPVEGFYVADDGVGIPEDERDAVLDPGYTTEADGTGLGLDIVTQIVEAHGWSFAVTESADGGARFDVYYDGQRGGERTGTAADERPADGADESNRTAGERSDTEPDCPPT